MPCCDIITTSSPVVSILGKKTNSSIKQLKFYIEVCAPLKISFLPFHYTDPSPHNAHSRMKESGIMARVFESYRAVFKRCCTCSPSSTASMHSSSPVPTARTMSVRIWNRERELLALAHRGTMRAVSRTRFARPSLIVDLNKH